MKPEKPYADQSPQEQLVSDLKELDQTLNREIQIYISNLFNSMSDKEKLIFLKELKEDTQKKAVNVMDGEIRKQFQDKAIKNQKAFDRVFGLLKVNEQEDNQDETE